MPELPEVEVVRRGLDGTVTGRIIDRVSVTHPRSVRRHAPGGEDFAARLTGRRVAGTARRGKYLWLPLDSGEAILAHLGMSGQLLVEPRERPDEAHLRVRLTFADDGPELRFVDQRTFGGLALQPLTGEGIPAAVAHIARDPLDAAFDEPAFLAALRRRRTGLKRALLDQRLVSGVGNIYADEALWRARLHYARATDTLPASSARAAIAAAREVMGEALEQGGTSFDAFYVNVNGQSGYFDRSLQVYGRAGSPCGRCGTTIRREAFMNRSSYLCPRCQPRPRTGRW